MSDRMEGGCLCGKIRYAALVADDEAYLCHCRMCQRWMGNVSVAFRNLRQADVTWLSPADYYQSSPIARRGFCAACGTSLSFEFLEGDNMDLTVASFDDPSRFVPHHHFGVESLHRHWLDTTGLPEERADEHAPTVDRWMKTIGKLPD